MPKKTVGVFIGPFLNVFVDEPFQKWSGFCRVRILNQNKFAAKPLWKRGGFSVIGDKMKPWAEKFYKGKQWKKCRAAFVKHRKDIDGGFCQKCGEKTGFIVHHIIELTPQNIEEPTITLNWTNLQYVCKD